MHGQARHSDVDLREQSIMGRRGGVRQKKLSHSIKKLLRRSGVPGVKGKKAKLKPPAHPGHREMSKHAKKKISLAEGTSGDAMEIVPKKGSLAEGTAKRAEQSAALSKQARLDLIAKRRGIVPSNYSTPVEEDPAAMAEAVGAEMDEAAAATQAAKRALAFAPTSQRSFHKELSTVIKSSDVLLEVLDARDPMGCRCLPLEAAVLEKCKGKRLVLILNKVDLVPADVVQRWLAYLRQYFPTLPFKAATQQGGKEPVRSAKLAGAAGKLGSYSADAYGGDGLLQLLKNYSRSRGMKTAITVGIVGYPNVGKSSLINSLKRARAVNVGATPGVTTVAQTITLDSKVKLMDCPGIVFARAKTAEEQADVVLRNCVKLEKLESPEVPIEAILRRVTAEQLMKQYDVGRFADATEFLTLVSAKRGFLRKGGAADHDAAARAVLHDWNSGALKYYTEPPEATGGVELVTQLADTFDWHAAAEARVESQEETAAADARIAATVGRSAIGGGVAAEMDEDDEEDEASRREPSMLTTAPMLLAGWQQAHERGPDEKPKPKKVRPPTKRASTTKILDDERFNFQHNRAIRKGQAKEKKKARRRTAAASMLLS